MGIFTRNGSWVWKLHRPYIVFLTWATLYIHGPTHTPFHIAESTVTQQLCPHSANPLCCHYVLVAFTLLSHWASDLCILMAAVWKAEWERGKGLQGSVAFPSTLFGAPFHIDNRTITTVQWLLGRICLTRTSLLWNVHIKLHYSRNAFDPALLDIVRCPEEQRERAPSMKTDNVNVVRVPSKTTWMIELPQFKNSFSIVNKIAGCDIWR